MELIWLCSPGLLLRPDGVRLHQPTDVSRVSGGLRTAVVSQRNRSAPRRTVRRPWQARRFPRSQFRLMVRPAAPQLPSVTSSMMTSTLRRRLARPPAPSPPSIAALTAGVHLALVLRIHVAFRDGDMHQEAARRSDEMLVLPAADPPVSGLTGDEQHPGEGAAAVVLAPPSIAIRTSVRRRARSALRASSSASPGTAPA